MSTTVVNSFPQQPDNDLRIDTAWRENYSGASMNRKLYGLLEKGVYRGFNVTPKEGLIVEVGGDENIALLEVNGFSLTASMPSNVKKEVTLEAGKTQYIVLEAQYNIGLASSVGIFVRETVPVNAVLLAKVTVRTGATTISLSDIEIEKIKKHSILRFDSVEDAKNSTILKIGYLVSCDDYYGAANPNNSGILFFKVVEPDTGIDDGGKYINTSDGKFQLQQNLKTPYNVKCWGARGNNDQTLYDYSRRVDNNQITITRETFDGIIIDKVLTFAKKEKADLYLPSGTYPIYGYMQDLNFSVSILGDGPDLTIIKNCDNSPSQHGYGIFCCYGDDERYITLSDLTLDSNGHIRGAAEVRAYPFAMYGSNLKVVASNIHVKNSVIDCWYSFVSPDSNNYVYADACTFTNAHRNTMSLVGAQNHTYVGCIMSGGGVVDGGTNPGACLDIEPNNPNSTVRNIKFVGCTFKQAVNQLVICSWGEVQYDNCTFDAATDNPNFDISGRENYPWLCNGSNSKIFYNNCRFLKKDNHLGIVKVYNENQQGEYADSQTTVFNNCYGEGVGVHAIGFKGKFSNCEFTNALFPFLVQGNGRQEIQIENLTLTNIFDKNNSGTGSTSSFAIHKTVEGGVFIDGLKVVVKPDKMPNNFDISTMTRQYGFYLSSGESVDSTWRIRNVHIEGYYRKLPLAAGQELNANNFRDWGVPNLPPSDDASKTINPNAVSYKDCTMRGDQ